jgi:hypothetical protein
MKTALPSAMRAKMTHSGGNSANANLSAMNELPHKAIAMTRQMMA